MNFTLLAPNYDLAVGILIGGLAIVAYALITRFGLKLNSDASRDDKVRFVCWTLAIALIATAIIGETYWESSRLGMVAIPRMTVVMVAMIVAVALVKRFQSNRDRSYTILKMVLDMLGWSFLAATAAVGGYMVARGGHGYLLMVAAMSILAIMVLYVYWEVKGSYRHSAS